MERQDNDWIVEIKDMSFSYAEGSRVILDDVSLSFRKGEVDCHYGRLRHGQDNPSETYRRLLDVRIKGEVL